MLFEIYAAAIAGDEARVNDFLNVQHSGSVTEYDNIETAIKGYICGLHHGLVGRLMASHQGQGSFPIHLMIVSQYAQSGLLQSRDAIIEILASIPLQTMRMTIASTIFRFGDSKNQVTVFDNISKRNEIMDTANALSALMSKHKLSFKQALVWKPTKTYPTRFFESSEQMHQQMLIKNMGSIQADGYLAAELNEAPACKHK